MKTTEKIKQISRLVDTEVLSSALRAEKTNTIANVNSLKRKTTLRAPSDSRSNSIMQGIDDEMLPCIRVQIVEVIGLDMSRLPDYIVGCRIISEEGVVHVDGRFRDVAVDNNNNNVNNNSIDIIRSFTGLDSNTFEFEQLNVVVHHGDLPQEIANFFIRIQITARSSYIPEATKMNNNHDNINDEVILASSIVLFQGAVDISLTELLIANGHNIEKMFTQPLSENSCKIIISTATSQSLLSIINQHAEGRQPFAN